MIRKVLPAVLVVFVLIQCHLLHETTIRDTNGLPEPLQSTSPTPNGQSTVLPPDNDTSHYYYYSWGLEGIDFRQVLRYINVTYYDNVTWSKPVRSFQPFTAYIVVQNSTPSLWVHRQILNTIQGGAGRRLALMLPHFQHALQVELMQQKERFPALVSLLSESSSAGSFPVLFDLSDYHECSDPTLSVTDERYKSTASVPLLTLARSPSCQYAFPIPTYSSYEYTKIGLINGTTTNYQWQKKMNEWAHMYPWDKKISQVYWRGGCKTERYHFIRNAHYVPYLNVRPVGNRCGIGGDTPRKAAPDTPEFSMTYKAVFDIDGNSWSERFPRLLCYNSAVVLLSLENDFEEYFMVDLQPHVHFIPASMENFTQVAETILKKENDSMLKTVVQNANQWCRQHMTTERLNLDFLSVLNGYVTMLNVGSPSWTNDWKRMAPYHIGPPGGGFSNQADGAGLIVRDEDFVTKTLSAWDDLSG